MFNYVVTGLILAVSAYFYYQFAGSKSPKKALQPGTWVQWPLQERIQISHDSFIFRFALPTPEHVLGLPIGQHIAIRGHCTHGAKPENVQHSYTPISSDDDKGHVDFLVKVYLPTADFPHGGRLTQHLFHLKVGDKADFSGPKGRFEYLGKGEVKLQPPGVNKVAIRRKIKAFVCLAGGSGITPIMQVIRAVVKHRADGDETKIFMIDANKEEDDILMHAELDAACAADPAHTQVWHTLSQKAPEHWKYDTGYVTEAMCRKHLIDFTAPDCKYQREEVLALICGPPAMEKLAVKPNLEKLGYTADNMFTF